MSNDIIEYRLIKEQTSQQLEHTVNKLLQEGYSLYGGMQVLTGKNMEGWTFTVFIQPMVKFKEL